MKSRFIYCFILSQIFATITRAQQPDALFVQFDKPFYVVGENAHYSIHTMETKQLTNAIVQVELINPMGQKVLSQQLKRTQRNANGDFTIPFDWKEGYYLFRAYTLWNLNFDTTFIYQKQIAIYNDLNKKIETPPSVSSLKNEFTATNSTGFQIILNKEKYKTREKIAGSVSLKNENGTPLSGSISVSIFAQNTPFYKEYLENEQQKCEKLSARINEKPITETYKPNQNLVVKGVVNDPITKKPVSEKYLSLYLKENQKFYRTQSDKDGNFEVELPDYYGSSALQILSMNPNRPYPLSIQLKNEVPLPAYKATLLPPRTPEVENYLYWNATKRRVEDIFNLKNVQPDTLNKVFNFKPDKEFDMTRYVDMGNLDVFFKEAFISARKNNTPKGLSLRLMSYDDKGYKGLAPFYRLDGLFVQEEAQVMALKSTDLVKVDVYERPETVRSQFDSLLFRYGLIDIKTLPSFQNKNQNNSFFVEMKGLYKSKPTTIQPSLASEIPDFRTVLFWNPAVLVQNGKADFSFPASDVPNDFIIVVMGTSELGKPIFATTHFTIEQ
jgi:hypothetical protein